MLESTLILYNKEMQCKEVILYYRFVEIQQVPKSNLKDYKGVFFVCFIFLWSLMFSL